MPALDRQQDFYTFLSFPEWTDCWLWARRSTTAAGYGQLWSGETNQYAHRLSWSFSGGQVPVGYELDHRCKIRNCVNPSHLQAIPRRENRAQGNATQRRRRIGPYKRGCV